MGISQEEMASLLGITKNYVWMLESGMKPITPNVRIKAEELVEKYISARNVSPVDRLLQKAEIDGALHESPAQYAARSPETAKLVAEASPGILRMADVFERHVLSQFSAIRTELKTISARLEKLEERKK